MRDIVRLVAGGEWLVCLRRINTEGREPRRHGVFLEWSFAHGNENKGIGLVVAV